MTAHSKNAVTRVIRHLGYYTKTSAENLHQHDLGTWHQAAIAWALIECGLTYSLIATALSINIVTVHARKSFATEHYQEDPFFTAACECYRAAALGQPSYQPTPTNNQHTSCQRKRKLK